MKGGKAVAISVRKLENQTCVYRCQNHRNEGGIYHHVYIEYKLLNKKNKIKNKKFGPIGSKNCSNGPSKVVCQKNYITTMFRFK